jgi:predicted dehydrogenase
MNIKLSQIGLGKWGPNLLRNFNNIGVLKSAYDLDEKQLDKFKKDAAYRDIKFGTDYTEALQDEEIKGIIIATPPITHYKIAMATLKAGKHLFIEKPMTLNVKEAEEIVALAKEKNLVVMVGHIFLYSSEIIKLKELISSEDFGKIHYIYTQRLNLGKIQDCGVGYDLAPHDISILDYLLDKTCTRIQTTAKAHIIGAEDVAFINMYYGDILCHLHLSWLDPLKLRNTVVVGSKQMAVCDSQNKTIELYNKGVDVEMMEDKMSESYSNYLMTYRYGDILIPHIDSGEPMLTECKEFIRCIKENTKPLASGELGLGVVRTLEAMQKSLKEGGEWVNI